MIFSVWYLITRYKYNYIYLDIVINPDFYYYLCELCVYMYMNVPQSEIGTVAISILSIMIHCKQFGV